MLSTKYFVLGFLLVGSFSNNALAQVTEEKGSWKYLVERTTTKQDKLANKKEVHIDRAFVYFGAGAKQAGGQIKTVPQVVYIDENRNPLPKAVYYEGAIVPYDSEKFGLLSKLPDDVGSDPNLPAPVHPLPGVFDLFPLKPEAELKKGLSWSSTLYLFYGMTPDFPFPVTIKHEVKRYKRKQGRKCAEIKYTVAGGLNMAEHPEWFTQEELRENRGEVGVKGSGRAYFDTTEGIIVEKEQTISWSSFGQKLSRLEDGSVGWATTQDQEKTVTIKVSLQPEEGHESSLPPAAYVLIMAAIAVGIGGLVLLLKKKASSCRK